MIHRNYIKSTDKRIIFVDTETTGIPLDQSQSYRNVDNWPSIRQIAWIVYKKDGTLVSECNYAMSQEDNPTISADSHYVPKVVMSIHNVLDLFLQSIGQCDVIVGHHISYDVQVILCELYRYGKDTSVLEHMQQYCTMRNGVAICGFDTRRGNRYPKLQELYSKLFHQPFENAHDAYCDIRATAECFWAFFNRGFLKKEDYPYLLASSEKERIAQESINRAVDLIDTYVRRGCPANLPHPQTALSLFDKALQLTPISFSLKERIGVVCLKAAKDLMLRGGGSISFRFLDLAAENGNGEALAIKASYSSYNKEEENLLLKAIEKGWIDAARSLYYLYKKNNTSLAEEYANMWLLYCEENFDVLPDSIATSYIRSFLYGEVGCSIDLNKVKTLCERDIANGHDSYYLYTKALELSGEWDKRFEVLALSYDKYLQTIKEQGGFDTIKKWGYEKERRGVISKLSPIVGSLFEGRGTKTDYEKAKELIDFGIALYDGHENNADYDEFRLLYYYLGQYYENGLVGVPIDKKTAFRLYKKASNGMPGVTKLLGFVNLYSPACKIGKKHLRRSLKWVLTE